jgi:hypothetical protein
VAFLPNVEVHELISGIQQNFANTIGAASTLATMSLNMPGFAFLPQSITLVAVSHSSMPSAIITKRDSPLNKTFTLFYYCSSSKRPSSPVRTEVSARRQLTTTQSVQAPLQHPGLRTSTANYSSFRNFSRLRQHQDRVADLSNAFDEALVTIFAYSTILFSYVYPTFICTVILANEMVIKLSNTS